MCVKWIGRSFWRNLQNSFGNIGHGNGGDYRLYGLTQSLLLGLLLSACVFAGLPAFAEKGGQTVPLLVALVAAALSVYLNTFLSRRRVRELAIYNALGMGAFQTTALFLGEMLLLGALCLGIGLLLGLPMTWLVLELLDHAIPSASLAVPPELLGKGILGTLAYFGGIHLVTVLAQLGKLLCRSTAVRLRDGCRNETPPRPWRSRLLLLAAAACFLLFLALLLWIALDGSEAPLFAGSLLLAPAALAAVFLFYSGAYGMLWQLRRKRPGLLYRKNWLPAAATALSKCRGNARMAAAVCTCFLIALCSCVTGVLCIQQPSPPADAFLMGAAQIYCCILFLTAALALLAVQNRVEIREYGGQLLLLEQLGMGERGISGLQWRRTAIRFGAPLLGLLVLTAVSAPILATYFGAGGADILGGIGLFYGILAVLLVCFAAAAGQGSGQTGGSAHVH